MPVVTETSKQIVLKYADKGSFRFDKIALNATDQQLYVLADLINSFQADPAVKVLKVSTKLIV